jgi:asparagine synthase (glutamine-hydrolysing)
LRRSPFVWEKAHPFIRDKWVVREVADRLMPRHLSQRIKVGFWTTTFQRMEASPEFYTTSRLGDLFGLSRQQVADTVAAAPADLRLRLLHCDVWMRVMIDGESPDVSVARLRKHVRIRGQKEGSAYRRPMSRRRAAGATF